MERRCTGIQNALELGDLKDKHVEQKTWVQVEGDCVVTKSDTWGKLSDPENSSGHVAIVTVPVKRMVVVSGNI